MNIKVHQTKYSLIVALCDKELIGKEIKEGEPASAEAMAGKEEKPKKKETSDTEQE